MSINILNRPVYKNVVRKYAAAIARGEWQLSHESIAISTHPGERLLDGQHRLLAVIEAGQPIMMTICYGAPAESFRVIGSGKTRSKADQCGVDRKLMEPINFLCFFHHHRDSQRFHVTSDLLKPYVELFEHASAAVQQACGTRSRRLSGRAIRAAAIVCSLDRDADYALEQYANLAQLKTQELPPVFHAYNRFLQLQPQLGSAADLEVFCKGLIAFDGDYRPLKGIALREWPKPAKDAITRIDGLLGRITTPSSVSRLAHDHGSAPELRA